jgi:cytochrome c oxidase subunit IV
VAKDTAPSHAESHAAVHGPGRYFVIWAILLGFTVLTVVTGRMDLGAANIVIALTIASVKATLVVLFFMHLSDAHGANRLVFVVSVLFVGVLMLGVFGDLMTRNPISLPGGVPAFENPDLTVPGHQ